MTTSKSPRRVLQVAYDAARRALPAHRHRFSPKKFTQPQLMACLVLKDFSRLDYRGLAAHLADHPDLTSLIGLKSVPHYTTFQKAAARLFRSAPARAMFDAVLEEALRTKVRRRRVPLAAVDGTGMESRHVSRYYVKRRSKAGTGSQETTYSRFPKVVLVTDCATHLVLAAAPGRGPASDLVLFKAALRQAAGRARIGTLLADADFDAEWVHEHARGAYGIRTLIPPARGRPSERPPAGKWRRWMKAQLRRFKARYGQRWQTETVNSMVKRRLGSALRARGYWSQSREIILRVITHNVMIVRWVRVFYRAVHPPFVVLFVIEFVDVVSASLGKDEMKVLAMGVGPGLSARKSTRFARSSASEYAAISFRRRSARCRSPGVMAASDRDRPLGVEGAFVLDDGPSKVGFVPVASPRILAEGDVAVGELVEVEDGDVASLVEDDAEHSSGFRVAKGQDSEGGAGDAIAMTLNLLDAEFHGCPPWPRLPRWRRSS